MIIGGLASGTRVRIVGNSAGHGLPIGTPITLGGPYPGPTGQSGYYSETGKAFYFADLELANGSPTGVVVVENLPDEVSIAKVHARVLEECFEILNKQDVESLPTEEFTQLKRVVASKLDLPALSLAKYLTKGM